MAVPRRVGFSQAGGLTGNLESGSQVRQGLADARRTAQGSGRSRKSIAGAPSLVLIGCFIATSLVMILASFGVQEPSSLKGPGTDPKSPQEIAPTVRKERPDMIQSEREKLEIIFGIDQEEATAMDSKTTLRKLFDIGRSNPAELAKLLEEDQVLGVGVKSPSEFVCPPKEERFSEPDVRNHDVEDEFKDGKGFIYYQHLRKAGGTGFCEMASRNMKRKEVPVYHCMPDDRGGMATPPWSSAEYLLKNMEDKGHRITANEWDAFPASHLDLPGAVFCTTFRHPVDRWFSQYRFEHLEHRDGTTEASIMKPFATWYELKKPYCMGDNYYVKTFCGQKNPSDEELEKDVGPAGNPKHIKDLSWSYHKFNSWGSEVTWENFQAAVEILEKFNLILILDYVDDELWALKEALGWTQTREQVLPHEHQAVRPDKKSVSAKVVLAGDIWQKMLESNVFDLLLFHWAKRMYLERSACREDGGNHATRWDHNGLQGGMGDGVLEGVITAAKFSR